MLEEEKDGPPSALRRSADPAASGLPVRAMGACLSCYEEKAGQSDEPVYDRQAHVEKQSTATPFRLHTCCCPAEETLLASDEAADARLDPMLGCRSISSAAAPRSRDDGEVAAEEEEEEDGDGRWAPSLSAAASQEPAAGVVGRGPRLGGGGEVRWW